jgi:hypothetical protein
MLKQSLRQGESFLGEIRRGCVCRLTHKVRVVSRASSVEGLANRKPARLKVRTTNKAI